MKFPDINEANSWIQKVISRFEKHEKYPLDIAILAIHREGDKYPEVLDGYYFEGIIPEN